jgi:uncharacterized protein (TIGR00290 family)
MPTRPLAAVSWSGGKDSCLAFEVTRTQFDFTCAVTMMIEDGSRSRSHGLRPDVLAAQAGAIGLDWVQRRCSWDSYEAAFVDALREAAGRGVTHLVCGDIIYPEHKRWAERMCGAAGLTAVEPLWGRATIDLYREGLSLGIAARIVSLDSSKLGPAWLFRELSLDLLPEFERLGVDPCGENGEYHTLVTASPAFARPLAVQPGEHVLSHGYWAVDVTVQPDEIAHDAGAGVGR